jgi:hypothetical protein
MTNKLYDFQVTCDATKRDLDTYEVRINIDGSPRGLVITCRRTDGEIAIYADDKLAIYPRSANLAYVRNVRD